ncbi:RND superfamily putative drug exporter [Kribbella pratensis]|uniref:RND superfamily putative drug exporter n=1 Tax=Kribbella pratensis TaxID=2512112 RepID=A0ABY2FLC9_9ACTN|nr:MMPL family transporter [Kribbella pratensis]TDW93932.1 RND superfamily putative drug exporter [Kribbella pratensis]
MGGAGRLAALPCGKVSKWIVLALWIVAIAASFAPAGKLTGAQENDAVSWLPGKAESTEVLKASEQFSSPDEIPAVLVYERSSGITPADQQAVQSHIAQYGELQDVDRDVVGPIPAQDHKALQVLVPINAGSGGWETIGARADDIRRIAGDRPDGLSFHVTGPGGFAADSQEAFAGIDGKLLYSAGAVVIIILLLTYRSPVLWLLPLVSAGVALFSAQAVVYVLATQANLTVNAQSAGILTVLVFGAGTDYALLLVARYREELRRHQDRHEAMAFALHRSGPAIVASGSTVVAGMLCLLFASMNSTRGLGPVAAVGIVIALLAMLTLLPALLVICGRWVFWPLRPTYGSDDHTETSVWGRIGRRIAVRPRLTWITTSILLGIASLGILTLNAGGLSNEDSFIGTPDSVVGEKVVAAHFPAGAGNPLVVISRADKAADVRTAMSSTQGIAEVGEPRVASGLAYLEGTMTDAADSQAAKETVDRVRAAVHAVPDADALAGGGAAILLDTQRASDHDNKIIIPVVLAVVLAILALLLRALVAPVLLVATVVLSFGAALGISSLVFKALGFEGADTSLPLFVFVFLVALGIDYNIFLMTRVHEESKVHGTRRGALIGVAATGGVITSAGLVLAGTFAVLATLPVVAFAEIGIAVALGVLLDTIVVRSVLVTALNLDVGRHLWWPSALARQRDPEAPESLPEPEPTLTNT